MPYFQVASEELFAAGSLVSTSAENLSTGHGGVLGNSGACAGTPAAGDFADFVAMAGTAVSSAHGAVTALAGSLREAGTAYLAADSSAANSLSVHKGP